MTIKMKVAGKWTEVSGGLANQVQTIEWGKIGGTIEKQTDLIDKLDEKLNVEGGVVNYLSTINGQVRNIYLDTVDPIEGGAGKDGDVWMNYGASPSLKVKVGGVWKDVGGKTKVEQSATGIKISEVELQDASSLQDGLMTKEDSKKLGTIAPNAQVNVIEEIKKNGVKVPPTGKVVDLEIPTATSNLDNDSDFATNASITIKLASYDTSEQVDAKLEGYVPTSRTINTKPLSGNVSLTPSDVGALAADGKAVDSAKADVATKATKDGSDNVITETYATKEEIPDVSGFATTDALNSGLAGKLDDTQLKTAWSKVPSNSNIPSEKLVKDALDAKAPADDYATKTELTTGLNKKVDKVNGKGLSEKDFTSAMESKLNGIATGAEVNVIAEVQKNGSKIQPVNKVVDITVPTKTSELANNSDFATNSSVNTKVGTKADSSALTTEISNREAADTALQQQIDGIVSKADVTDVVGTKADLEAYPTGELVEGDVIKVLADESKNGERTYYRWETGVWKFVGSEGISYTKSEADGLLAKKVPTSRTINSKALTSDISLNAGDVGALSLHGKADDAVKADSATKATKDGADNVIVSTYATKTELSDGLAGKVNNSVLSGYVPTSRTINTKPLSANITLGPTDIGALAVDGNAVSATKAVKDGNNQNIVETYATKVENNAKLDDSQLITAWSPVSSDTKIPSEKLVKTALDGKQNAGEYVPTSRKVNNKALTGDISLTYTDVGAQKAGDYATNSTVNTKTAIVQNADGISIGGNALQDATTAVDGLMTKAQVNALNGKANSSDVNSGLAGKVNTTQIVKAWGTTASDEKIPSEKLVKAALDGKQEVGNYQPAGDYASKIELTDGLAGKLGKNENAVSASKATNDGNNQNIVNTYATKIALTEGLAGKQNAGEYATTAQLNAVKVTAEAAMPKAGGTFTGPITINSGDDQGIIMPEDANINAPGNKTVLGFLDGTFTINHTSYGLNLRGSGAHPKYNGADMALKSEIPDISGKANDSAVVHKEGVEEISGNKAFMGGLTTPDLLDDELTTNAVMPVHQIIERFNTLSGRVQALEDIPNANGRSY